MGKPQSGLKVGKKGFLESRLLKNKVIKDSRWFRKALCKDGESRIGR